MLKKLYNLTLILFALTSCNNLESDERRLVEYQGKTNLKINLINCNDSASIGFYSLSNIPFSVEENEFYAKADSLYQFTFNASHPILCEVWINNKQFPLFTVPNDTLNITFDLSITDSITADYMGETKYINEYYQHRNMHMGYSDICLPATNYTSPSYSIYEGATKIDSLYHSEEQFFRNYINNNDMLPDWFIKWQELSHLYGNASFKLNAIFARNELHGESTKADDPYFDFLEHIPINHPNAIESCTYLFFLDAYFYVADMDKLGQEMGCDRVFKMFNYKIPHILNTLSAKNQEVILAIQFSEHYFHCAKVDQVHKYDSVLNSLSKQFKNKELLNILTDISKEKNDYLKNKASLKIGEDAPYFYLCDKYDQFHSLVDYKGKMVYLSFWATWCSPCVKSIPSRNSLIERYTGKDIVFINISLDDKLEIWKKYLNENKVLGLNLACKGDWKDIIYENFDIKGIPRYILIDIDGRVLDSDAISPSNGAALEKNLNKYLEL